MLAAWRICQSRHVLTAMSGEGARLYPGRWNHKGIPMVYTADSVALAVLEILVNLDDPALLSREYTHFSILFHKNLCKQLEPEDLPVDWAADPCPRSTRNIGSAWIESGESVILRVPSAVVHVEYNFIINPLHPDFRKLKSGEPKGLRFDERLTR